MCLFDLLGRYLGDEMFLDTRFTCELPDGSLVFIGALGPAPVDGREDKVLDAVLEGGVCESLALDLFQVRFDAGAESRVCDEEGAVEGGLYLGEDAGTVVEVAFEEGDIGVRGELLSCGGRGVAGKRDD